MEGWLRSFDAIEIILKQNPRRIGAKGMVAYGVGDGLGGRAVAMTSRATQRTIDEICFLAEQDLMRRPDRWNQVVSDLALQNKLA